MDKRSESAWLHEKGKTGRSPKYAEKKLHHKDPLKVSEKHIL